MSQEQILTENGYSSRLTSAITVTTGDFHFTCAAPTQYTRGYLLVGSESNPDVMYYHLREGNTFYVTSYNRRNAQTHAIDTPVRVGSPAELFNLYAKLVTTTFYAEATAALTVTIFGGYFAIG